MLDEKYELIKREMRFKSNKDSYVREPLFVRRDPYRYRNTRTMKNKFGLKDKVLVLEMEANYTSMRLREIALNPIAGTFDFDHFCKTHAYIFQDIYDWAGQPRTIDMRKREPRLENKSIEYAPFPEIRRLATDAIQYMRDIDWLSLPVDDQAKALSYCFASLWQVHTFREGNTRTVVQFCSQYADSVGLFLDRTCYLRQDCTFRDAFVHASAVLLEYGDNSEWEILHGLMRGALTGGQSPEVT